MLSPVSAVELPLMPGTLNTSFFVHVIAPDTFLITEVTPNRSDLKEVLADTLRGF